MILNAYGTPVAPLEIVERLRQVDDRLGLRWVGDWWALTMRWLPNDPRREKIQKGLIADDDTDIVTFLPKDCSVDQAFGYLERGFERWPGGKDAVAKLLSRLHKYNAEQVQRNMQETLDLADELISTNAPTLFKTEGKTVARTKAPRGTKNRDKKQLDEFLREGP
jgi:hypothetical protein